MVSESRTPSIWSRLQSLQATQSPKSPTIDSQVEILNWKVSGAKNLASVVVSKDGKSNHNFDISAFWYKQKDYFYDKLGAN